MKESYGKFRTSSGKVTRWHKERPKAQGLKLKAGCLMRDAECLMR